MVTLSGGVQTTNNVPLTGNVQQTVSPNSASAGGNVFNQTYAPDVTLVPRQPVNFNPTQPLSPLAPMSNLTAIPGPSGSPINIPTASTLQNAFAAPKLQGSAQRGQADSIIVGRNAYSPGAVTAQGYDPYGGYAPPQQQQPVFMQPPRAQYQMPQRPLVDPNQWAQMQQLMPQLQPNARMQQLQGNYQRAQDMSRQAMDLAAAPIAPPLYMQNTRAGRLERAMRGLTHGGQKQMIAGQNAYYEALTKQPDQMRQAADSYAGNIKKELDLELEIQAKNAEIAKEFLKQLVKIPSGQAQQAAADFMMKQWPEPETNPRDLDARLRYAEWAHQVSNVELAGLINLSARNYAQMLENKELTATKSEQQIYKNAQTMDAQIDTIKSRAKSAAARAEVDTETKEYRKEIIKLTAKLKALDVEITKSLGIPLKKAQLEGQKLTIQKTIQDLEGETAKNYDKIDKSWNAAMGRYMQAINTQDDDAKAQALDELNSYGPPVKGTEKPVQVPVMDANGNQAVDQNGRPRTRPVFIGIPQQVLEARKYLKDHAISQPNQNGFYAPPPALNMGALEQHPEYKSFVDAMVKKNNGAPPTMEQMAYFAKKVGISQ